MEPIVIGVDVGTGSARAGVFNAKGTLLGTASHAIKIFRPPNWPLAYQQSTSDIWSAVCNAVHAACALAAQSTGCTEDELRSYVKGISFDATCSLAVLGPLDKPLCVSPPDVLERDAEQNIVLWLDHRAREQARRINTSAERMLQFVGGVISPEHEVPKLLWLKENLAEVWSDARLFLDLTDYLTYKCTNQAVRSLCCVTCKWAYDFDGRTGGWDPSFMKTVGLDDLTKDQIGGDMRAPGEAIGPLTPQAAEALGLHVSTMVGVGMIDAHAGGLGCVGAQVLGSPGAEGLLDEPPVNTRLALICGTSTCHLISSPKPVMVPGVWGPFFGAMVPHMWLTEGGQSATGALLDHIIRTHPSKAQLEDEAAAKGVHPQEFLVGMLEAMAADKGVQGMSRLALLARDMLMVPHFAGCRSPLADPDLKGIVMGLTLESGTNLESLALLYLVTIQALAYGTRHIIEALQEAGHAKIEALFLSGGLSKNRLFVQQHADITHCLLVLPKESEGVLLGAAMLAASAAGLYASVQEAMTAMSAVGNLVKPSADPTIVQFHASKYKAYHALQGVHIQHKQDLSDVMGLL